MEHVDMFNVVDTKMTEGYEGTRVELYVKRVMGDGTFIFGQEEEEMEYVLVELDKFKWYVHVARSVLPTQEQVEQG